MVISSAHAGPAAKKGREETRWSGGGQGRRKIPDSAGRLESFPISHSRVRRPRIDSHDIFSETTCTQLMSAIHRLPINVQIFFIKHILPYRQAPLVGVQNTQDSHKLSDAYAIAVYEVSTNICNALFHYICQPAIPFPRFLRILLTNYQSDGHLFPLSRSSEHTHKLSDLSHSTIEIVSVAETSSSRYRRSMRPPG
jgi:hypothetical protein